MSTNTLEERLKQFPLPVAVHLKRNVIGAAVAVTAAVVPYIALEWHVLDWLFVLPAKAGAPTVKIASFLGDAWTSAATYATSLATEWPLAEFRILGWLVLPSAGALYSVWLDRATDGKLNSTQERELEHLDLEADAAEGAMCKLNQSPEETHRLANTLRTIEPRKRHVRRVFSLHRHDLTWACFWPWLIASLLMFVAWGVVAFRSASDGALDAVDLLSIGGPFFGGLIVYGATIRKGIRWQRMKLDWQIISYIRNAVRNAGAGGSTL